MSLDTYWLTEPTGRFLSFEFPTYEGSRAPAERYVSGYFPHWTSVTESDFLICPIERTAFSLGDEKESDGNNYIAEALTHNTIAQDPRSILKKALDFASFKLGPDIHFSVGFELEYYLLSSFELELKDKRTVVGFEQPKPGVGQEGADPPFHSYAEARFSRTTNADFARAFRRKLSQRLLRAGIKTTNGGAEVGFGQQEVALNHNTLLEAADSFQITKEIVRQTALDEGLLATFMPMPIPYRDPSGVHINISVSDANGNLFADTRKDERDLRNRAISGLLAHLQNLTAILCPTHNSFCRLAFLYSQEAPSSYGVAHRGAYIRLPPTLDPEATRIELRVGDATMNPYHALAAVVLAIIDGIESEGELASPSTSYTHPAAFTDIRKRSPQSLPTSLSEALTLFSDAETLLTASGVFEKPSIDLHRAELASAVRQRMTQIHPWDYQDFGI